MSLDPLTVGLLLGSWVVAFLLGKELHTGYAIGEPDTRLVLAHVEDREEEQGREQTSCPCGCLRRRRGCR